MVNISSEGESDGEEESDTWVKIGDITLTNEDKRIIIEGKWLNDKIIHAAQTKDQVAALMHTEENSIKLVYAGVKVCDCIYQVLNTHSSNSYLFFFLYRNKQTNVTVEFLP